MDFDNEGIWVRLGSINLSASDRRADLSPGGHLEIEAMLIMVEDEPRAIKIRVIGGAYMKPPFVREYVLK